LGNVAGFCDFCDEPSIYTKHTNSLNVSLARLSSILVLLLVQAQCQIWGIQIVISYYDLGGA